MYRGTRQELSAQLRTISYSAGCVNHDNCHYLQVWTLLLMFHSWLFPHSRGRYASPDRSKRSHAVPQHQKTHCVCCDINVCEYLCPGKPYADEPYCGHLYCDACISFCRDWHSGQLVPVCKCCATFQPIPPHSTGQNVKFINGKKVGRS